MVDLHVHSHWSDGEFSPRQLVQAAVQQGLSGIALTDHDTLSGLPELEQAGAEYGLPVYGGIEISCTQPDGRQLHLLGYDIPSSGRAAVEAFCRPIRLARNQAVLQSVRTLQRAGYPVSEAEVRAQAGPGGDVCKQYIMQILIDKGQCRELYGALYRTLFKRQADGTPGIAALSFAAANPEEAVRCVAASGGRAVLAHPGQYGNFDMVPQLVKAGLSGIEAYHPKHTPLHTARCLELAGQYGLFVTGGSDFHGRYGEGEHLGEYGAEQFPFVSGVRKGMVRTMTEQDYPHVYALWTSCTGMGLNDMDDTKEGISRFLARNPQTCFVFEDDGKISGAIMAGNDGRRGYIYHTAVVPDMQNHGIGTALVQAAVQALRQLGITKVALVAFERNQAGNRFWEKQGFSRRDDLVYRNRALIKMRRLDT